MVWSWASNVELLAGLDGGEGPVRVIDIPAEPAVGGQHSRDIRADPDHAVTGTRCHGRCIDCPGALAACDAAAVTRTPCRTDARPLRLA